jgi:Fungal chitosanase of glycosyl hydrolase group 75
MTKSPPKADKTITVKEVGVIAGVSIYEFLKPALRLQWDAGMTIDCDGSGGNPDNDPYFQPETSLKNKGKSLNAYKTAFIVVPPFVIGCVKPIVMGCQAAVINLQNGLVTPAVVGDCGPTKKIGEASCKCAEDIGLDGDPNSGGTEKKIVRYMIWPGIPALVDGITYKLQPS